MREYDLIVIGAGSGNMVFGPEFDRWRCAIIEPDRFGGTCLNRGCIPSKMFVVAADAARAVADANRLGIDATLHGADWPAIRDRVFARIDPIHDRAVEYRRRHGVDVFTDPARFVAPRVLEVGSERLTAKRIVVASGSRPAIPDVPGLVDVPFHTSDTIMRIDEVPGSMLVIGGGFIAAEMGHVFSAFGASVTIVQRGPRLLMAEDEEISARFTDLARRRFRLETDAEIVGLAARDGSVEATVRAGNSRKTIVADALLVAAGRRPNTDLIDAEAGELAIDRHGHLIVDDRHRTSVEGVWALGDAANHFQLKHMANAEMRVVRHNLLHPERPKRTPVGLVPHAVFSEPQIAAVGLTERQARATGRDISVALRSYSDTAYGWALEDSTGFVKLVADRNARSLLGAHILGPHAAILIQPLLQAMMLGQSVDELAHDVLYIHPALTEVVEQALLDL